MAATPEGGRQAVRDAWAEGYDFIKVYSQLSLETFSAIVDEARKHKMRVVRNSRARTEHHGALLPAGIRSGRARGRIRAAHESAVL